MNANDNKKFSVSLNKKNFPIIVHFNGKKLNKPWLFNSTVKFKSDYWKYRNKTIYKRIVADDITYKSFFKIFKTLF